MRNPGTSELSLCFRVSREAAIKVLVRTGASSVACLWKGLLASLFCYWWNLAPFEKYGPYFLAGCCLEALLGSLSGEPQYIATSSKPARKRVYSKLGVTILYHLIMEATSRHLCLILLLEASLRAHLPSKGGNYIVVWIPGGRDNC